MKKAIFSLVIFMTALKMLAQTDLPAPPPPPSPDQSFDNNEVYFLVQSMPSYPGGDWAMQSDIANNTTYPEAEFNNKIGGKVYVSFTVEKDGSISDVKADRTVPNGPGFTPIAIEAIKKLKPFTPGKMYGKPVRVRLTVPVNFAIKK